MLIIVDFHSVDVNALSRPQPHAIDPFVPWYFQREATDWELEECGVEFVFVDASEVTEMFPETSDTRPDSVLPHDRSVPAKGRNRSTITASSR